MAVEATADDGAREEEDAAACMADAWDGGVAITDGKGSTGTNNGAQSE
jgi:hypothetical protein